MFNGVFKVMDVFKKPVVADKFVYLSITTDRDISLEDQVILKELIKKFSELTDPVRFQSSKNFGVPSIIIYAINKDGKKAILQKVRDMKYEISNVNGLKTVPED